MAERRMFTKKISDSDNFTELPAAAQALYFHLNQGADDDGFNNQIQNAMFKAHASVDDLKLLLLKNFVIRFESGVIVIKHWRMHNTLRKDRYTPTSFQEELKQLGIKDNGAYTFGCQTVAKWLPQDSIGKDSIGKDSIDNFSKKENTKEKSDQTHIQQEDAAINAVQDIYLHWNSKGIIVHKKMTEEISSAIERALKVYSDDQIRLYIDRYTKVIGDSGYFWSYKWTLKEFLSRKDGISSFTDEGSKWVNYCDYLSKSGKGQSSDDDDAEEWRRKGYKMGTIV